MKKCRLAVGFALLSLVLAFSAWGWPLTLTSSDGSRLEFLNEFLGRMHLKGQVHWFEYRLGGDWLVAHWFSGTRSTMSMSTQGAETVVRAQTWPNLVWRGPRLVKRTNPDFPAMIVTGGGETGAEKAKKVKAGFLYIGPIGDGGWTYAHDAGRRDLETQTGVGTVYQELVPESPASERVMETMIAQGCNVIVGTSFGYMDYMENVSKRHPDVIFLHCSGYKTTKNMGTYFGRMYQARYLSGIVAGLKTKSNTIGYVAAYEIPEVIRGINAFTLGVRSVNPRAVVKVKWSHTWYDPAKEMDAALALLDAGVDVVAQHQDTAAPQQAAEARQAWSIGYNTEMNSMAPKACMTASIWNWGPYYVSQIKAIQDGTWKSSEYWGGLKEDIVRLAPLTANAPAGSAAAVDRARRALVSGELKIFRGPLKDQSGVLRVKGGEVMSDRDLLLFDWFVEGVEGSLR